MQHPRVFEKIAKNHEKQHSNLKTFSKPNLIRKEASEYFRGVVVVLKLRIVYNLYLEQAVS